MNLSSSQELSQHNQLKRMINRMKFSSPTVCNFLKRTSAIVLKEPITTVPQLVRSDRFSKLLLNKGGTANKSK